MDLKHLTECVMPNAKEDLVKVVQALKNQNLRDMEESVFLSVVKTFTKVQLTIKQMEVEN